MREKMDERGICATLRAHAMIAKDKELCSSLTIQAIEEAVRIIEEERWHPVEEGHPDSDEYVLLSFVNFSGQIVGRWENDNFFSGDDDIPLIKHDLFVNAWKKLRRYEDD